ncbi:MAG: 30S ribosome-binding factor RbfA [Candidatus Latescibacterota bacterium]
MASHQRTNRLRELLLREVSDIVMRLQDPRVRKVTVVDTELSRDLRYAKVFVSLIGTPQEQREATQALENALGYIRHEVAQRVKLRFVPELRVVYDSSIERAARVTRLIDSVTKKERTGPEP